MAVRYAVATGNWNTDSTWNDGTTLGIPTGGDEVYLNGFNVTVSTTNITCGTIRNDLFADTGNSGGKLIISSSSNTNISSNLIAENTIITLNNNITLTVNGNVTCLHSSGTAAIARSGSATIFIYGDVISNGGYLYSATGTSSFPITIVGNITINDGTLLSYVTAPVITLNGTTITLSNARIINMNAVININNGNVISTSTTAQYPLESDVKYGVPYGYVYVGTYQPEYPLETVVLNGINYAEGTMTGTLQACNLPQSVISRMQNAVTVDIFQQILDAHLNN